MGRIKIDMLRKWLNHFKINNLKNIVHIMYNNCIQYIPTIYCTLNVIMILQIFR